jgi:hypothetical protein
MLGNVWSAGGGVSLPKMLLPANFDSPGDIAPTIR